MTIIPTGEQSAAAPQTENERIIQELLERKRSGKALRWEDFSFDRCQEMLKDVPGNFSDLVIEERSSSW